MEPKIVATVYREQKSLKKTGELCGGRSTYWVRMRLIEAGEPINPPSSRKIDDIQEVLRLRHEDGLTYQAIAQVLSENSGQFISASAVRRRVNRYRGAKK